MPRSLPHTFTESRRAFIEAGGNTTQSLGMGRIIGQIYALLYLSPRPICLDEIVEELGVSKASVSTAVRQLAGWGAVKRVWVKGDRRDFYEAETDFGAIMRNGVLEVIRKKLNTAGMQLAKIEESLQAAQAERDGEQHEELALLAARLKRARKFHDKLSSVLGSSLLEHLL